MHAYFGQKEEIKAPYHVKDFFKMITELIIDQNDLNTPKKDEIHQLV